MTEEIPPDIISKIRKEVKNRKTKRQVADELNISYYSVKKHTKDIITEKRISIELERKIRHADNESYREFIRKKWGEKAVVEWLFHIAIDYLVTAYRSSNDVYCTAYNYYRFALPCHGELVVDFDKLSYAELIRRFRDKNY